MKGSGRCENDQERSAGYPRGSFAAEQQRKNHHRLLPEREMHAGGLRDKNERERLVKAGAIHVEAVTGGEQEGDERSGDAEGFQLLQGDRQSSFRAGGGKAERDGLDRGADEGLQRNPRQEQNRNQHEKDEEHERDIHGGEQLQERKKDCQTHVPDGVRDRAKDADGRGVHDQVGEFEHDFGEALGEGPHRSALGLGNERQGHGEEDAEHHDLQDLAFGDGFGDVLWKNIGDELRGGMRRKIQGFAGGGGGQADAFARAAEVDGGQTDEHGDGGNDFEVHERLDAQAAYSLQVGVAGDAHHQNREKQRRDDDADQTEEDGAEKLELYGEGGRVVAEFRAGEQADEDPGGGRAARSGGRRDESNRQPAQKGWNNRSQRPELTASRELAKMTV